MENTSRSCLHAAILFFFPPFFSPLNTFCFIISWWKPCGSTQNDSFQVFWIIEVDLSWLKLFKWIASYIQDIVRSSCPAYELMRLTYMMKTTMARNFAPTWNKDYVTLSYWSELVFRFFCCFLSFFIMKDRSTNNKYSFHGFSNLLPFVFTTYIHSVPPYL